MIYIDDELMRPTPEEVERWTKELPDQRRQRVLAIHSDLGRRQSLLVYRLLCRALQEGYGIDEPPTFEYGLHGKPMLRGSDLHFSLSHCREAVACVVERHPVGIDVERIRPARESLVRYTMNDAEQAHIFSSPDPDRSFIRLWTQKEAVFKLLGTGIRGNIKEILSTNSCNLRVGETERYVWSVAE